MNKKALTFYWMCKQIQLRNNGSPSIVASYAPYAADVVKFNLDILALEALMPAALIIGTGYTLDQNVNKNTCSEYWDTSVCKIIKGFALKYGKNAFFQEVNFTVSKLNRIPLPQYYAAISSLNEACEIIIVDTQYVAGDYAVTSGILTAGMALANSFLSVTGEARHVKSTKGATNFEIKGALKTLQTDLNVMDNDIFGITTASFRNQYFRDRKIIVTIIHNTINFYAVDSVSGDPIDRVFIINQGATVGDYTNIDGYVDLNKKSGTNILVISHKDPITKVVDYIPQTIRVKALYKKAITVTIELVKIITSEDAKEAAKKTTSKNNKAIEPNVTIDNPAEANEPEVKAAIPEAKNTPASNAAKTVKETAAKKVVGKKKK
jgi:hypothetical protein